MRFIAFLATQWHLRLPRGLMHIMDNNHSQSEFQGGHKCLSGYGKLVHLSQRCQSQIFMYSLMAMDGESQPTHVTWFETFTPQVNVTFTHHFSMLLPLNLSHNFRIQPSIYTIAL